MYVNYCCKNIIYNDTMLIRESQPLFLLTSYGKIKATLANKTEHILLDRLPCAYSLLNLGYKNVYYAVLDGSILVDAVKLSIC